MEKFAGYGFNKSHAAAYALIAYQTAYFKAHHPAAFMAANLSLVMDDTDKVRHFRDDAMALGLTVLPPDVNASNYRFEPVDDEADPLRPGRHQGHRPERHRGDRRRRANGGPVRDLFDFCRRVDKRVVNRRAIEALVRAGAFDAHRHAARKPVRVGRRRARPRRAGRALGVAGLALRRGAARAGGAARADRRASGPTAERLAQRKGGLGFYLSGHPYESFAAELALARPACRSARSSPRPGPVLIAGIVTTLRVQTARRGKMAFVTLDDGSDPAEIVVLQRDLRRRSATCCARTSWSSPRSRSSSA